MLRSLATCVAVAFCGLASVGHAGFVLFDDFDAEVPALNQDVFQNFVVFDGTVDLVSTGMFSIVCAGGTGNCVDLDGSTQDSGVLTSQEIFGPGLFELRFFLSGNQRDGNTDSVLVSLGDLEETFSLVGTSGFQEFVRVVTIDETGSQLRFAGLGGDNVGLVLDDVSLARVPEVGSLSLLLLWAVVGGVARVRRRGQRS